MLYFNCVHAVVYVYLFCVFFRYQGMVCFFDRISKYVFIYLFNMTGTASLKREMVYSLFHRFLIYTFYKRQKLKIYN